MDILTKIKNAGKKCVYQEKEANKLLGIVRNRRNDVSNIGRNINTPSGKQKLNFAEFHYFQVLNIGLINGKTQQGFNLVQPVVPSCSGVHIEHTVFLVIDYLQNMRMSADEEFGPFDLQRIPDIGRVSSRTGAPDMGHPDIHSFATKALVLGELSAHIHAIDVAKHCYKRFKGLQLVCYGHRACISCMPYLIAALSIFNDLLIKVVVRIGEEQDASHLR